MATNEARFYQGIALEDTCRNRLIELVREVLEVRETRPAARSTHHRPSKIGKSGSAAKVHEPRKLLWEQLFLVNLGAEASIIEFAGRGSNSFTKVERGTGHAGWNGGQFQ